MKSIVRITALSLLIGSCCPLALASHKIELPEQENIQPRNPSLLQAGIENFIPTGSVISFAGATAPQGWLICDGAHYSSQKYPQLYAVIKTSYVSKNSWIHEANKYAQYEKFFCVPDMRGRTSVGVDSNAGRVIENNYIGASGGEEKHLLTVGEMPSHDHSIQYGQMTRSTGPYKFYDCSPEPCILDKITNTNSSGDNQPHNIMQPYLCLNYIIKH